MFPKRYTISQAYHLLLRSAIIIGLTASCSTSDELNPMETESESTEKPNTHTGIALNNIDASVLQASVESFQRSAAVEQPSQPSAAASTSDGGLACDVAWSSHSTHRASATGYTLQWGSIGTATQIAIQPRNYAATSYSTYNVSAAGTISATSPYYFETANSDVITSWYPYNSGSLSSFAVQSNQSTLANYIASDLLYASSAVNATSQSLSYSHKMAQIIVDVTVSNANYLTNSEVQSLTIAGLKTNCTTNFASLSGNAVRNPTFTTGSTTATITAYRYAKSSTSTTSTATFILCVPAQTISTSQVFTVTVGGTAYTGKLSTAQALVSGAAYNLNIGITAEKIRYIGRTSSTYAVGDFYATYANGQSAIIANTTAALTTAKNNSCTPIAYIFSKSPITSDQNRGWTMGYALSISYTGAAAWSTNTSQTVQSTVYAQSNYAAACSDMNGYDETHRVTDNASYNSTTYPAFFTAVNYISTVPVPKQTSGWFLPSFGQCFIAHVNLYGGYSNTSYLKTGNETQYRNGWRDGINGVPSGFCATYESKRATQWSNVNSVFSPSTASYTLSCWTSTESSAGWALCTDGYDDDGPYIGVQRFEPKTSPRSVIPALAF